MTMTGDLIGTLRYMSPEQALAKRAVIDQRSDIYSLGATLYELLTLKPPYEGDNRQELLKQIAFENPPKPRQLSRSILPDLETIVLKSIEKRPDERYATAGELADDLRAFLEDRPIKAKPPNLIQRSAKWSRRHKPLVWSAGASSAILLLVAVVILAVSNRYITVEQIEKSEALVARTKALAEKDKALTSAAENLLLAEKRKAEAISEATRAGRIVAMMENVFESANPDSTNGSDYTVRELLDSYSRDLDDQLDDYPEVEATIRLTLGKAYYRLWESEKAELHLKKALDLRRLTAKPEELAETLLAYALQLNRTDLNRAEPLIRESLAIYRDIDPSSDGALNAMHALQLYMRSAGKRAESEAIAEEALAIARASDNMERAAVPAILHSLGTSKRLRGELDPAIRMLAEAVALHRHTNGNDHPETAWALDHLYRALAERGDYSLAELACLECLALRRKLYGHAHMLTYRTLCFLGTIQQSLGERVAAIRTFREAIALYGRIQNDGSSISLFDHHSAESATMSLVVLLTQQSQDADAMELLSDFTPQTAAGYLGRARYYEETEAIEKALSDYVHAVEVHPGHVTAKLAIFDFCERHDFHEKALVQLDESIVRHPVNPGLKEVRKRVMKTLLTLPNAPQ